MKKSIIEIAGVVIAATLGFFIWFMPWPVPNPSAPKKPTFAEQCRAQAAKNRRTRAKTAGAKTAEKSGLDAKIKKIETAASIDDEELEELLDEIRLDDDWASMKALAHAAAATAEKAARLSEDAQSDLVDALADFSPTSLPEIAGFLGSQYEDVREDAAEELANALSDMEERDAAAMISRLAGVVSSEGPIDEIIFEIDSFEPEWAAAAMLGVLENGTAEFKKALYERLDDLLDREIDDPVFPEGAEPDAETAKKAVRKWLEDESKDD